jgi:predicted nucleotidyltransferase
MGAVYDENVVSSGVMTKNFEDIVTPIVIRWLPDARAIYIFGSMAGGTATAASDIDVAVLCAAPIKPESAFQLKTDLSAATQRDIDLVDLLRADDVTRAQVITTGKLIFCNDPAGCAVFETSALAKYAHLNEERREIISDIIKRGSVYGG